MSLEIETIAIRSIRLIPNCFPMESEALMTQTQLKQFIETLKRNYESTLNTLEHLKTTLPSGSLRIQRLDGHSYYSRRLMSDGRQIQIAIPTSYPDGKQLIKELVEKRIVNHGIPVLRKNVRTLEQTLEQLKQYSPEGYIPNACYKDIIGLGIFLPDNLFLPGQLNIARWIADTKNRNYQTNSWHPEHLIFETKSGHMVRSKSELQIDDLLYQENMIFRYESALWLPIGKVIYPDFTILHPTQRRLIFFEHFGRLSDPNYVMNYVLGRLMDYAKSGYILGRDVFFTMESSEHPLERRQIIDTLNLAGLIR